MMFTRKELYTWVRTMGIIVKNGFTVNKNEPAHSSRLEKEHLKSHTNTCLAHALKNIARLV